MASPTEMLIGFGSWKSSLPSNYPNVFFSNLLLICLL